jgi:hypothetical protein
MPLSPNPQNPKQFARFGKSKIQGPTPNPEPGFRALYAFNFDLESGYFEKTEDKAVNTEYLGILAARRRKNGRKKEENGLFCFLFLRPLLPLCG